MTNRLDEAIQLVEALDQAGFIEVYVMTETDELVHADESQWWARVWASSTQRAALQTLDAEGLERYKAEAWERLQLARGPDGFHQRIDALFGLARNP